jgi:hypothetical protein
MTEQELQDHVKSGKSHNRLAGNSLAPYSMGARPVQWYPAPPIMCYDGFSVSIQAGQYSYCQPRNNDGPYTHFELGFPSRADELIQVYAEDPDQPTGTVYPQVPLELVLALIAKHGGRVEVIDL